MQPRSATRPLARSPTATATAADARPSAAQPTAPRLQATSTARGRDRRQPSSRPQPRSKRPRTRHARADDPPARRSRRARARRHARARRAAAASVTHPLYWLSVSRARPEAPVADAQSSRLIALRGATTVDADARGDIKPAHRGAAHAVSAAQRPGGRRYREHPLYGDARPALRFSGRGGPGDRPGAHAAAVRPGDPGRGRHGALRPRADPLLRTARAARHHVYLHEARELRLDLPSSQRRSRTAGADQGRTH